MKKLLFLAVPLAVLAAPAVFAHGSEESFEKTVGNHFVDVGYDEPLAAGKDTLLDAGITDVKGKTAGETPRYSGIVVKLESGSVIQWRKEIPRPQFGKPVFSLMPERGGNWVFRITFMDDQTIVADAAFPVLIPEAASSEVPVPAVFAALIFALSTLVWSVFFRKSL